VGSDRGLERETAALRLSGNSVFIRSADEGFEVRRLRTAPTGAGIEKAGAFDYQVERWGMVELNDWVSHRP
jgi:hypothetical protein